MKKHLFTMVLCACTFLPLSFYSCSQGSIPSNEGPATAKSYTVHLGFGGEITDISTSPLMRAEAADSDIYGIQVYSCPDDTASNANSTYTYYAYGLFNDKSDMTISLLQGYKYRFACTMVVNGKNKLANSYMNGYSEYGAPFGVENSEAYLNNQFTYSTSNYFVGLSYGSAETNDYYFCERPNIDRYYGELTDFTPAENKTATILMKRAVFGAKFIAEGLTGGKLKISMSEAPDIYIAYPDTTVQNIFTFDNIYGAWAQDNYSETITVSISWTKADGAVVPLATQDVTFKRNMLTTITVKVNDATIKNGISINTESTSMGDGGSVTINGGSSDSTKVNP
ncbi:MAG: hypothetical protein LKI65_01770 [Prevotella sp.]|jgi:hypothetical protein|nr:hypothetical protein [Prevotella sp.]MCI1686282.1 hypothetical protein [Prevotella sp.]MCI1781902.1 hypothetical protein [Prevotella sp.]MCI1802070.1 hypothetical protein [Prevotella sp.]